MAHHIERLQKSTIQAPFFKRLNYSFGNEDWKTEAKALSIRPSDRVVCVTGSGDRPLNLLMAPCRQLVALDANPWQSQLLSLKAAALKTLDYQTYLGFLGAAHEVERGQIFESLRDRMDAPTYDFWSRRPNMVAKGVLYEGVVEKLGRGISVVMKGMRGKQKIDKLFAFDDLQEQKDFLRTTWKGRLWQKSFALALHPRVTKILIKDPGLYDHLQRGFHPGVYIFDRIHNHLERFLAKESLLISLIFNGRVTKEAFPAYLTEVGHSAIRKHLPALHIETQGLIEYLEGCAPASLDVFSLSDVASYLNPRQFERLLRAVVQAATPGARFCIRQFLSSYEIPDTLQQCFRRDTPLEEALQREDCCAVYRFMVGTIYKQR